MPVKPCECMKRTNLTAHVDFIVFMVAMLGFKFLDDRIVWGLIAVFLIQYTLIRVAESGKS